MSKSYSDLLRDPRWQRKRLEVLEKTNFTCELCEASDKTLHVHHRFYKKGAMPWEYENKDLHALCEDCHDLFHYWKDRLNSTINKLDLDDIEQLAGYAEAMVAVNEVFSDHDAPVLNCDIKSHSHAFGFGARLKANMPMSHQDQLIDASPLSAQAIFSLTVDGIK